MPDEAVTLSAWRNPIRSRTATPIATSGAVNRPGKRTPQVNPITVTTVTPAAPVNTGQSGAPPQVACKAVWIYRAATPARNASSIQPSVAASAMLCLAHAARGVVATRSTVFLRPSRDPAHAARPPAVPHPAVHLFAAELRIVTAAGRRPDINNAANTRTVEQGDERIGRERALPNSMQRRHRHGTQPSSVCADPLAHPLPVSCIMRD